MFANISYAETVSQTQTEIAKSKFNAMVADITDKIQASYKAGDSFAVFYPATQTSKDCWVNNRYDVLQYDAFVYEPQTLDEPLVATLEIVFGWYFTEPKPGIILETRKDAESIPWDKDDKDAKGYWEMLGEEPFYVLFTYEYKDNNWKLAKSQYAHYFFRDIKNYRDASERKRRYAEYKDFKKHKLYTPFDVCLVKNLKKSPWYKP